MKNSKLTYQDKGIFLDYKEDIFNKADYLFFSGGTTGKPKVIPFSKNEWDMRARYRSLCYKAAGLKKHSNVAIMLPFGPWIAGPSAHEAVLKLECGTFPLGIVDTEEEAETLLNLFSKHKIRNLITTPSFLYFLCKVYKKRNFSFKLERIYTSGEVTTKEIRQQAKEIFGSEVFSCYASSETFVGIECEMHDGYHFNRKFVDVNVANIEKEKNVVLLTVKHSDLIKITNYKIGDLGVIKTRCVCKLKWPRVKLVGRSENGFLVTGAVNVYPHQIKEAIFVSGIHFTVCNTVIHDRKDGVEFIEFEISTESSLGIHQLDSLKSALEGLSLDFSDVIHHGLVRISIKNKVTKRSLSEQKSRVIVHDKRKHAKEN